MLPNTDKIRTTVEIALSLFKHLNGKIAALLNMRWMLIFAAVFAILGILLLHFLGVISIKMKPLSTKGSVYVDSPEIYTRERLVNDRYDQDFWLNEQLRKLDEPNSLYTAETHNQVIGGVAKGANTESIEQPVKEINNQDKPPEMPFNQVFRIRTAIRDTIRQLILENILDDRHDLTGNSVYGLKFDTTVIPGDYTRDQAFVRVKLTAENPFVIDTNKLQIRPLRNWNEILPHQNAYYLGVHPSKPESTLYNAKYVYMKWLGSIKDRLNLYLEKKFKTDDFRLSCEKALQGNDGDIENIIKEAIRETFHVVLGYVDKRDLFTPIDNQGLKRIMLPPPWVRLMRLSYRPIKGNEACLTPPDLDVKEQNDYIYVFGNIERYNENKEKNGTGMDKDQTITHIKYIDETFKKRILSFQLETSTQDLKKMYSTVYENWESFKPSYSPSDALIDLKCTAKELLEGCGIYIPSGLFNFIERLQKSDFYSYAVFPKNEVAGVFSTSNTGLQLTNQVENKSWLNITQRRRESQLESVLVGFGDGGNGIQKGYRKPVDEPAGQEEIQFGWVLSNAENMSPTQKTEMALVSVPAWTTQLKLHIKTGWLDRDANENTDSEFDMDVPVPPDFQALDSLILNDTKFQRKPKILSNFMESNIKVMGCHRAKILIPGTRLWRSTMVTLGAQKADRITVLPNMEGIIAEFNKVDIPYQGEGNALKTKLQVWTSEGVDTAENDIEIQLPEKNKNCPQVAMAP